MRRETRFRLLRIKDQLIELMPFVAIAAAIVVLVWAILNWSEANNEISRSLGAPDEPTPEELAPQPE